VLGANAVLGVGLDDGELSSGKSMVMLVASDRLQRSKLLTS
jgi:uncharacterized protein YbjQ (UPF0145 family)